MKIVLTAGPASASFLGLASLSALDEGCRTPWLHEEEEEEGLGCPDSAPWSHRAGDEMGKEPVTEELVKRHFDKDLSQFIMVGPSCSSGKSWCELCALTIMATSPVTPVTIFEPSIRRFLYTGWGKSRFAVVCMGNNTN